MTIEDKLLSINPYSRSGEKQGSIQYIVVHYVGNANTSALANRNYFENLSKTHKTSASSHYIIGLNGEIIRCIPDYEVAFHAGSYSMNRKSIGIENCHPDWEGKFNDKTYKSLVELTASLCKQYNININHVIRHYDVTGKCCPKYYVNHSDAWQQFKQDVQNKLNGEAVTPVPKGDDEQVKIYKNGSTTENVYSDTNLTTKIGSINPYEQCECLGIFENRAIVRYKVDNKQNYKIGFAKWLGGIQQ